MDKMLRWISLCALLSGLFFLFHTAESCNEAVCASIVSKCMLTQSCKCDLKNCSCCKDCFTCLSYLYSECCSCVDMCPKPNDTGSSLSKKSVVEDISSSIPGLFQALTVEEDTELRWTTFTYPIDHDLTFISPKLEIQYRVYDTNTLAPQEIDPAKPNVLTINCTVAYVSDCMSFNKCKSYCQSMGASSYRWFHDGCCECVGNTCVKYGVDESRCLKCSSSKEVPDDYSLVDEDDMDYGEDFEED